MRTKAVCSVAGSQLALLSSAWIEQRHRICRRLEGPRRARLPRSREGRCSFLIPIGLICFLATGCGSYVVGTAGGSNPGNGTLVVSTSDLAFGSVAVGQSSSASVSVRNGGSSAVEISQIDVAGQYFSVSGQSNENVRIAKGSKYDINVKFAPETTGAQTGTVTLVSPAGNVSIALTGTGTAAPGVLDGLTCTTNTMTGAGTDSCTVTLTAAAGSGGVTVGLGSSASAVVVPGSVTVPAGAASATFTATVTAVTTAEAAVLTATAGTVTESYTIQLGAAVPGLTMSPGSLGFGSVTVNTDATPQTVTLTSSGTAALTISAASVSGAGFTVAAGSLPVTLQPGQKTSLTVGFDPTASGAATGAVTLTTNTSAGTATIGLTGMGTAAPGVLDGLTCTTNSMTGSGTDSCTVTLTAAAGSGGVTVGLGSSASAVAVPGSVTVPAGAASATFTATVTAVTTAEAAVLTATAGTVTESYTIQLGAAVPGITLQSTNVPFGDVTVNTSATQTVLVTSSGTAALTISAAMASGAGFTVMGPGFPVTLQPGQTVTLSIQFDPTATGAVSGAVTLTTNTSAGVATIGLTGTGEAASYEVNLSWNPPTDSTDPVAGYDIYRAVSGSSSYQLLNSSVDDQTTYTDTTVQSGTSYIYYVVSVDASGNQSAPSNLFTATIP